MNPRIFIGFALCCAWFLCGCVVDRSVRNQEPFASFIGRRFETQAPLFLVRNSDENYDLVGERLPHWPVGYHPTFKEFESGKWKNRPGAAEFIAIIPAETMVEIVDVRKMGNMEFGVYLSWFGHIVPRGKPGDPQVRFHMDGILPQSFSEEFGRLKRGQRR